MKKAVHFGAGNIGRGFIGLLLHRAGYEVVFADVVDTLVHELNVSNSYRVVTLNSEVHTEVVNHVRAVRLDSAACKQEIVDASIITTAVGLRNLVSVAEIISEALHLRYRQNPSQMLNIMACENAIRATTILKEAILSHCDDELRAWIESMVGFADVAVDRIAPNREGYATQPLDAVVERYFEWDIEQPALKGQVEIPGVTLVEKLDPYLERKLFVLNGAHAAAAYAGFHKSYETIFDAMQDPDICKIVSDVQYEAILGLMHRYPQFRESELTKYAESVRERFLNPHIHDDVARVGRDPLRKLSANDRLVGPLRFARAVTHETPGLVTAIAFGFAYNNPDDEAATRLQRELKENGIDATLARVTGIMDEGLLNEIKTAYLSVTKQPA